MSDLTVPVTTERVGVVERPITRRWSPSAEGHRIPGRPDLVTSYRQDFAMLDTPFKRRAMILLVLVAASGVLWFPNAWVNEFAIAFPFAIGAIGLNLVTGYAGQVSLGHAFFVGVGAFTAAVVGGANPRPGLVAFEVAQFPVWLLAAGVVAAAAGFVVAPIALRLRGLYLAIVTLALVFIGQYVFNQWDSVSGGEGVGRSAAVLGLGGFRFDQPGQVFGVELAGNQFTYLLMLVLLVAFAILAKNVVRSDVGRAFAAVRDRDTAAEVIGVDLTRTKILAFTLSSFYAGVSGALIYSVVGVVDPAGFNLALSVQFLAMVLIGGAGTIAGGILGALFLQFLGTATASIVDATSFLPPALTFDAAVMESVLGGVLLVAFLLFEPTGLFGIWQRLKTYWKGWPFTV